MGNILFSGFTTYLNEVHDIDMPPDQFWFCTLATTVLFMGTMCSALFLVSMTFDRFYSIIRPHKAVSFNTVKRAKFTIVCIVAFSVIFNIPNYFMTVHEGRQCVPYVTGIDTIYGQIFYWFSFAINFILPFVLLLIMNSFIIHVIRKSPSFKNKHNSTVNATGKLEDQTQNSKVKSSERHVYAILLLVTFGFLVLTTPSYVFFIYTMMYDYSQSPGSFAFFYLFYNIAHKMYYTNQGINFYLYVVSGGKFRADLKKLFKREKLSEVSMTLSSSL